MPRQQIERQLSLSRIAIACLAAVLVGVGMLAAGTPRDLSIDERHGGHTLQRHVGRSDRELAERLAREHVSAASTYPDRPTAERVVGSAIDSSRAKIARWAQRQGRRPNLVLDYRDPDGRPIGRALTRGGAAPRPCTRAIVVLKWDERAADYFVLTSYPEPDR